MTVKELMEQLNQYDGDMEVAIYDEGLSADVNLVGMEKVRYEDGVERLLIGSDPNGTELPNMAE
jgi:hypothetical protein